MHKFWLETSIRRIAILRRSIFTCCKSCKSFFININSKRIYACDSNIYSHIKLIPINQERIRNILTHNIIRIGASLRDFTYFACNKNSSSLRLSSRLKNPKLSLIIHHVLLQVLKFIRKNISFWKKSKMLEPMDFSQLCNSFKHQIFFCNVKWARKMINFLILLKTLVNNVFDWTYIPNQRWTLEFNVVLIICAYNSAHNSRWLNSFWLWATFFLRTGKLSESIVFQSISYYFYITVSHVEVVSSIRRLIRSYLYRIFINSKYQILLSDFAAYFYLWPVIKKHARKL